MVCAVEDVQLGTRKLEPNKAQLCVVCLPLPRVELLIQQPHVGELHNVLVSGVDERQPHFLSS